MSEKALQQSQVEVLKSLYSHRFCTNRQLAVCLKKKDPKAIQKKLQILEVQGLIGKRYDASYKLAGRAAEYYLTPKGARQLRESKDYIATIDERVIKLLYQNKKVSDVFVRRCIRITETLLKFKALYINLSSVSTWADMASNIGLPRWKPDAYITRKEGGYSFFLDAESNEVPFFVLVRKVRSYLKYVEETWLPDTIPRPIFLIICENTLTKNKLRKQLERALEDFYDNETVFALTVRQQFNATINHKDKIWEKVTLEHEPVLVAFPELIKNTG